MMIIAVALVLIIAFGILIPGGSGWAEAKREGDNIILDSGRVTIMLNTAGKHLALTGIKEANGPEWITPEVKPSPLWKIAFSDGKETKEIGSDEAELRGAETGESSAVFIWKIPLDGGSASVTMCIRVHRHDPLSYWTLRAKLPDGWKVTRSDFPMLPGISASVARKMAAPVGWGLEYDVKPDMGYEANYPSLSCAMQFLAFYGEGHGLYISAQDIHGNHKVFSASASQGSVDCMIRNWPGIAEKGGNPYEVPFAAAIGVFDGNYYQAAQIYREFSFKMPWGKAGPVSKRLIPQWVKDTDLWLMPESEPLKNVELCKKAKEFFGVPISLHWYNWHEIPFDTLYPDYFPAKPHFAEGVKALQAEGFHVMPYINGRLVDPNSKGWTEDHLDKATARQENGEPYTEVYGSKVPLHPMCPSAAAWQKKVVGLVDELVNECGVDGVYIDQIGAAWPYQCYNPKHGHPLGSGHAWVDGYRKMLNEARKKLPKNKMLTTEENAECWIDQFDAQLMANTPVSDRKIIPLFPSVYAGRAILFGFQYIGGEDISQSIPFRAKMAQEFIWGAQMGWISINSIMAPDAIKEAEFLRDLAKCRCYSHKFLLCGEFLGMIDVRGDNPKLVEDKAGSYQGTYLVDLPAVIASAWRAEDGSIGIAVVNMSDEEHEVEMTAPLMAGKSYKMKVMWPQGRVSSLKVTSPVIKVSIAAREARILAFGSK